jgi:hypothetical protein
VRRRNRSEQRETSSECRSERDRQAVPVSFELAEFVQENEVAAIFDVVLYCNRSSHSTGSIKVARGRAWA